METAVRLNLLPVEALTTAWFLAFVNDWFDAVNARQGSSAIDSLKMMLEVIKDLSFSDRRIWKPIQAGIQLTTTVT